MPPEIEAIGSDPVWPNWSEIIRILNEELAGPNRPFELIQSEVRHTAGGRVTLLLTPYAGGWMTEDGRVVETQRGQMFGFTVAIVVAGASTFPDITIDVVGQGYLGRTSSSTILRDPHQRKSLPVLDSVMH